MTNTEIHARRRQFRLVKDCGIVNLDNSNEDEDAVGLIEDAVDQLTSLGLKGVREAIKLKTKVLLEQIKENKIEGTIENNKEIRKLIKEMKLLLVNNDLAFCAERMNKLFEVADKFITFISE
jgi:tRNA G26 N,N-dimethylase Trm1